MRKHTSGKAAVAVSTIKREKFLSCQVCNKSFSCESARNAHLYVHSDTNTPAKNPPEDPHVVEQDELNVHEQIHGQTHAEDAQAAGVLTHTGDRLFSFTEDAQTAEVITLSCQVCNISFLKKDAREKHMRLHNRTQK